MELWIRSTSRSNFLKARFLTIMEGNNFYKKNEWEYKGYTIANCTEIGNYEILGTYKTEERALEVLDEIQNILLKSKYDKASEDYGKHSGYKDTLIEISSSNYVYEMPKDD